MKELFSNPTMIPLYSGLLGFLGVLVSVLIKVILDSKINNKKLKAEVIAKSRVEWIQEFRKLMSEFLTYGGELTDVQEQLIKAKNPSESDEASKRFKKDFLLMQRKKNLLLLYLPQNSYKKRKFIEDKINENNDHISIIDAMNKLSNRVKRLNEDVEKQRANSALRCSRNEEVIDSLAECTLLVSDYLKREWEKSKRFK